MDDDDKSLWELLAFSDRDERHKMMADVIGLTLSWQVRAMRKSRGWSQAELADKMQSAQTVVSRLENPAEVLHVTTKTLMAVAAAFDVALMVRMTAWKEWMEKMLGPNAFAVPASYHPDQLQPAWD